MNQLNPITLEFAPKLEETGLATLGWFIHEGRAGLLLGNFGGAMWPHFSASPEFSDGKIDPLNRWTARIVGEMAGKASFRDKIDSICFPFGMPIFPFQQWAMQATGCRPSPLGILIDPQYGLWWGLRAAILFADPALLDAVKDHLSNRASPNHPCDGCAGKPCKTECPVDAFVQPLPGEKLQFVLDVKRCHSHLDSNDRPDCMALGCRARAACPFAREHEYSPKQLQFHMKAFRG